MRSWKRCLSVLPALPALPALLALGALGAVAAPACGAGAPGTGLSSTDASSPIGRRGLVYEGRTVFLSGSGSFWLLSDPHYYRDDGSTNLERLRAHLDLHAPEDPQGKALGVIRVGAFGTPVRYRGVDPSRKRYPCVRSATPGARDGGNKFDCSRFDEAYFAHARTVAEEAAARGIVLGIVLWDEIPLERRTERWGHNPFCPQNNINRYALPPCSGDAVPEFYDVSPGKLRDHQDAIVRKFVDTLAGLPNVLFFVSNEYTGGHEWRDRQVRTIDTRGAAAGAGLPSVTMRYRGKESPWSDGVSPGTHDQGTGTLAFRTDGRPSIAQRDRGRADRDERRRDLWRRFMDGAASAGTRDDYDGDTPPGTDFPAERAEDRRLRRFVNAIAADLAALVPDDAPFDGEWSGRRAPGELVAYHPESTGTLTVDLGGESGPWRLIEWNPAGGGSPRERGTREAGGPVTWKVRRGECAVRIVREGPTRP